MATNVDQTAFLARQVMAAAILREAGRIADSRDKQHTFGDMGKRIMPLDVQWAVEDYLNVLVEMGKKGF